MFIIIMISQMPGVLALLVDQVADLPKLVQSVSAERIIHDLSLNSFAALPFGTATSKKRREFASTTPTTASTAAATAAPGRQSVATFWFRELNGKKLVILHDHR
jgi:hypothetical protein